MTYEQLIFALVGFILGFLACGCIDLCDQASKYFKQKNERKEKN